MQQNKVLLAGATGYVGGHILNELKRQGYFVRAVVRNPEKLKNINPQVDEVFEAEVTNPLALLNCCNNIDTVITSVGITRQKDGHTYMDVDYQANLNLLNEAQKSGVKRFIYIFIFNAEKLRHLKIIQAKQKFADELKHSGLNYCLINPTGFFSDMGEFLQMAQKGKVTLFGNGNCKMNPIDGKDLAEICVNAVESAGNEINAGGPEILTHKQIAETGFEVINKPVKIRYIHVWIKNIVLFLLRTFTSVRFYGPIEFLMTVLTMDMVAPQSGSMTLKNYFTDIIEGEKIMNS